MDYTEINNLLDNALQFATGIAQERQSYQSQLAAKDKQIADLQNQLTTVTATSEADETEIKTLNDKLVQLSNLFKADQPVAQPAATA